MIRVSAAFIVCFAVFLGLAPIAAAGEAERCRNDRDRSLRALAEEKTAIETVLDNDAAVSGAAEFHLDEARKTLIDDIEQQWLAVERRFRACSAGVSSGK